MNIETLLCRAFCDGLSVKQIGSGLSVATPFEDASGDRIGFYLVHDEDADLWRIEDDGALVPTLIAGGVAVEEGARGRLFQSLLKQAHAQYDSESGELKTAPLTEAQIPGAAMRFVALLLRVAGLSSLRPEIVYTTFREDAVARNGIAEIECLRDIEEAAHGLADKVMDLDERATKWREDWDILNGKRLSAMRQLEAAQTSRNIDVVQECVLRALKSLGNF